MRSTLGVVAAVTLMAILTGCGVSSITINPNFSHQGLQQRDLKRDDVQIVKVTDGRKSQANIGIAQTGMMNQKTPYHLKGSLAEAVKTMLDTLISGKKVSERVFPIHVSIDMFEVGENTKMFSEEGYFACNLRFMYPVTPDSMAERAIFTKQTTSGMDVTDGLEPLIYKGVADCVRQFVNGTFDKLHDLVTLPVDSATVFAVKNPTVAAGKQSGDKVATQHVTTATSNRVKQNEISFQYCQGDKIGTGVRGSYSMLSRSETSQFPWGLGISLTFYDVKNKKDGFEGSFINFGGRLAGKYYFSDAPTTAYLGGSLGLAGGTERIRYGTREESTFFFGPNVEEVVGITLGRKVSLEAGAFQLAHFGSKLLPDDVGFIVGISFTL